MTSSTVPPPKTDYPALTALRGVLALFVVLYHFSDDIRAVHIPLPQVIERGYLAVSAFFILSGFILSRIYAARNVTYFDFIRARFARVYPVYFLGILAIAPIVLYAGNLKGQGALDHIGELMLTVFCLQAYSMETYSKWNLVGWSISCEAFFYLLFPFIATILLSFKKIWLYAVIVGLCIIAGIGHDEKLLGYNSVSVWVHQHSPIVRLPEFCLGMAVGLLPTPPISKPSLLISFSSTLFLLLVCIESVGQKWMTALIPAMFSALILLLTTDVFERVPRMFIWLGKVSYALYITHVITATYTKPILRAIMGEWAFALQIFFALGVAHLVHKYWENPLRERFAK